MRTIRLIPLTAAATAAVLLTPASALARHQGRLSAHASHGCKIRLDEVQKTPLVAGESTTLVGKLTCPAGVAPVGQQVTVYEKTTQQPGVTALAPVTSEATSEPTVGAFEVTPPVFTANSAFYAVAAGAKSATRRIRVAAQVTPEAPTPPEGAQLVTGDGGRLQSPKRVDFAGTVKPYYVGERVVLQRESSTGNEEWRAIQVGEVKAGGKYLFEHRFLVPGEASIRVVAHPRTLNAPAASTPSSYEISQVQNPRLTLETKLDPLSFGQTATLEGIVQGATTPTPVMLYERNAGGRMAPVESMTTMSGYKFTPTPAQNTIFQVRTATAKSALLFEGVRHLLTFTPPASAIAAGQPLPFSGSVQPAGRVYLERQNAGQLGWHVIDSLEQPTTSFLFDYTFSTPGPERLRIKVPGGDGHQATASAPFEVNVTPAAASALTPGAASHVHLPPEGQI